MSASEEDAIHPLTALDWRGHRNTAAAALVILMLLAIRLNQSRKGKELSDAGAAEVAVTWDDMRASTGFAKATIGKGICLLESLRVIEVRKAGRSNIYKLNGVDERGGWCQLPQAALLSPGGTLKHLKGVDTNRIVLSALKIYVLLVALRRQQYNTTSIAYSGMVKHTGIRRADIPQALSWLVSMQLIRVSEDPDARSQVDRSQRYLVMGLTAT